VLGLSMSENIMKMVVFPQFVFANLTSLPLQFRVKEGEVTYHQIRLPSLRVDEHDKKNRESQPNVYVNELTNLSTEKFKTNEVLKQLFDSYEGGVEVFTGSLSSHIAKRMVYSSGKEYLRKETSFLRSTRDYLSDFSDNEHLEQRRLKKESLLA
jgi:hypothetical protein